MAKFNPWYLWISVVVFSIGLALFVSTFFMPVKIEKQLETVVILKPQSNFPDLTQVNEGTFIVNMRASFDDVKVDGSLPTKVQLFSSKVAGLSLYYVFNSQNIQGGTPPLMSSEVNLFDGNMHQVVYTFKKGEKQKVYVDTRLVAEADYIPFTPDLATGAVVLSPVREVVVISGNVDLGVQDHAMSEDALFG